MAFSRAMHSIPSLFILTSNRFTQRFTERVKQRVKKGNLQIAKGEMSPGAEKLLER